jgi:hypothetical protein
MMSAFHPLTTEQGTQFYVGSVPISDSAAYSMNLVGAGEQRDRARRLEESRA